MNGAGVATCEDGLYHQIDKTLLSPGIPTDYLIDLKMKCATCDKPLGDHDTYKLSVRAGQ